MILVDTSVWIDHLRAGETALTALLDTGMVLMHPFVIGELALGTLRQRETILGTLSNLPQAIRATDAEVLHFINRHGLAGRGAGYVDIHLLAAAQLTHGAGLWTTDKRLRGIATELGLNRMPAN